MRYLIIILLLVVSLAFFSSCKLGLRAIMFDDGGVKADRRMEQIISAINDKDSEAVRSLFSKKTLDEADDIESEIHSLFDYLHGDIDSWERDGLSGGNTRRDGKITNINRFSIIVNTDKEIYKIYVIDYSIDTINPENEGVYMLEVYKSSYSGGWDYWSNRMHAGIRIVKDGNEQEVASIATERLEEIIKAIQNKDKDALIKMFSEKALSESLNLDENIKYLFDFFEGNVTEFAWDNQYRGAGGITRSPSKKVIRMPTLFFVSTDKQDYLVYFLNYPIDEFNPNNTGLYSLCIVKAEDNANVEIQTYPWYPWEGRVTVGVYNPGME